VQASMELGRVLFVMPNVRLHQVSAIGSSIPQDVIAILLQGFVPR
jgi:hypothetical protein